MSDSKKKLTNKDRKEKIANSIIALMEQTGLPAWRCPWIFGARDTAYKGGEYRGVNAVITALARTAFGCSSRLWLTHTKIEGLNGKVWTPAKNKGKGKIKGRWVKSESTDTSTFVHIKKDTHGVPVIFWDWVDKKDKQGNVVLDANGNPVKIPFLKTYTVHNASHIENFDPTPFEPEIRDTGIDVSSCKEIEEKLLGSYVNHPAVVHGGDKACYFPALDQVSIPDYNQFTDVSEFASTVAHELAHSTGHKSRLGRNLSGIKGSDDYAFEELVAEFTAAMVLGSIGIDTMPSSENSAAYLKSWLTHLKKEPSVLFDAISAAKKAAAMLLGEKDDSPTAEAEAEAEEAEQTPAAAV